MAEVTAFIDATTNPRTKGFATYPGPKKSELNRILADVYGACAQHWWRHFRLKHFTPGGAREYNYSYRKPRYTKLKRKHYGHNNPLELTGTSKRNSWIHRIVKNRNGAKCVMPTVRTFNYKPSNSDIDMRDEFTRTSEREIADYGILARKILRRRLRGKNVKVKVNL